VRRLAGCAALLLASAASLATSPACDDDVSLHDEAHLDGTQGSVRRGFRISAPGPTHPRVKLTASGGDVRVTLSSDGTAVGAEPEMQSTSTTENGAANLAVPDCVGTKCSTYPIRVTVEWVSGAAVDVSWDTIVEWDACVHNDEFEQGRVEIVRDDS
jgi:hypothetical protein